MDIISTLPDNLLGLILEKLSVIDRVKTSALSRTWRLKWILVSSLTLDYSFYISNPRFSESLPLEYATVINSLLLQHDSSLREFILYIPYEDTSSISLFQHSIVHATRNRCLEVLSLEGPYGSGMFALPSSIFSAVKLRNLFISYYEFFPPSWFQGFPNLTRLVLETVVTTIDSLKDFFSVCPKLEKINLSNVYFGDDQAHDQILEQKLDIIASNLTHLGSHGDNFINLSVSYAPNLKSIFLSSSSLSGLDASRSEIFKLFKKSLQLQHILLTGGYCEFLGSCSAIEGLPRFDRVKKLEFRFMSLHDPDQLRCFLSFCVHSPNVRNLHCKFSGMDPQKDEEVDPVEEVDPLELESMAAKYIDKDLQNLVRVDLFEVSCQNIELKIIELLLRFSLVLEVMNVDFDFKVTEQSMLQFVDAVANCYRISTKVKVHFTCAPDAGMREAAAYCREASTDIYFPYIAQPT